MQSLLQRPWFCLLTDWWILNYYLFLSCPFDCTLLDVQSEHYIPVSNRATLGKDATQKSLGMRMPSVFRLEGMYKNWHLFLFSGSICGIERLQLCTLGFKKLPVTLKHHKSILHRPNHQILVLVAWGRGWAMASCIQSIWGFQSIYWGFTLLPMSKHWHYWFQSKFSLLHGVILKALCINCSSWVTAGFHLFCSF